MVCTTCTTICWFFSIFKIERVKHFLKECLLECSAPAGRTARQTARRTPHRTAQRVDRTGTGGYKNRDGLHLFQSCFKHCRRNNTTMNGNKQVTCEICHREMRSDNLKHHMNVHEIQFLDEEDASFNQCQTRRKRNQLIYQAHVCSQQQGQT